MNVNNFDEPFVAIYKAKKFCKPTFILLQTTASKLSASGGEAVAVERLAMSNYII